MASGSKWSHEELILAFRLYCETPFGKIHNRNSAIIEFANLINRSPSAVSWKLANFASLDPAIQQRGLVGATHGSKQEIEIWNAFQNDWESLVYQSEILKTKLKGIPIEDQTKPDQSEIELVLPPGLDRESIVKIRVNQRFFRSTILASYQNECSITGLNIPSLLTASHIVPWAKDAMNRINPRNGLCLNSLHDRAFDRGLLTIGEDYKVVISKIVSSHPMNPATQEYLLRFDGKTIKLPDRFAPDLIFLKYHRDNIFQKN